MAKKREYTERNSKRGLGFVVLALLVALSILDVPFSLASGFGLFDPAAKDEPAGWGGDDSATDGGGADVDEGAVGEDDAASADGGNGSGSDPAKKSDANGEFAKDRPLDDPIYYVRAQLSEEEQEAYDEMYRAFTERTSVELSLEGSDALARIRDCVIADHPEIFYVDGISYSGGGSSHSVTGMYLMSESEAASLEQQIEEAASECLSAMPSGLDDYGKAKYVYEWVVRNTEYGGARDDGQNIDSVLVDGQSVCAGYAKTFQYLMQHLGFSCVFVTGETDEPHGWCCVRLDGKWYNVDPTWGDPTDDASDRSPDYVSYEYLCLTDEELFKTHFVRCSYDVPTCTSTENNYYVCEGLLLDDPDVAKAGAIIASAQSNGEPSAQFRCASREVYDELLAGLFDEGKIYDYLIGSSVSYVKNEELLTLRVTL